MSYTLILHSLYPVSSASCPKQPREIIANVRLLNPKNTLLPILASQIPFEIAIGLNGRVWIKSPSISESIALRRVLEGVDDGVIGSDKAGLVQAIKEFTA